MKKIVKFILITVASLFIIYVLAAVLVSPITKWYLESHSKEIVGRTVKMEDLNINLFTGSVDISNVVVYENDDMTSFFSMRNFETNLDIFSLLKKKIVLEYIYLIDMNLHVVQNGESYNFDDIITHFSMPDSLTVDDSLEIEKSSSWGVVLNDIQIQRSNVFYKDLVVGSDWGSQDFSLIIPGVDLSNMEADMGIRFNFTNGGSISMQINYVQENQTYELKVMMEKFGLNGLLPYLQQGMNIEYLAGMIDVDLQIKGSTQHIMDLDISGTLDMSQFAMGDYANPTTECDSLHLKINNIEIEKQQYQFDSLTVYGIKGKFENYADHTSNISRMLLIANATNSLTTDTLKSLPDETSLQIKLGNIVVRNGQFVYIDHSLPSKLEYLISEIKIDAQNFNPDSINNIRMGAIMQKTGSLRVVWIGNFENAKNQNVMIDLKNIAIADFTPYSLSYFGYPVSEGTMSISSQNVISNYQLNGINKIEIAKLELDEKDRTVEPEYNVPLKLGLYLLTDNDQKINLDLPVSGSVNTPTFSYRKLIINTLENVLLKVIASPFSMVSGLIIGEEELQCVSLEPCQIDFTLDQYAQFDRIAALLQDKPEIHILLEQRLNYKQAVAEMAEWSLKRAYYLSQNPQKEGKMDLFDQEALESVQRKDASLLAFADSLLASQSLSFEGDIQAKALTLYAENAENAVRRIMQCRNETLKTYLIEQKGVSASQLQVESMSWEMMQKNEGKNLYNIELLMQEIPKVTEE